MYPQLPNHDEYKLLSKSFPTQDLLSHVEKLELTDTDIITELFKKIEFSSWKKALMNRILDLERSYIFAYHYFNQGIPDQNWHTRTDKGIEFFPEIENHTLKLKVMFKLFSNMFFRTYFSILDNLGHLFFIKYKLELDKPLNVPKNINFKTILEATQPKINPDLHYALSLIDDFNIPLEKIVGGKIRQAPPEQITFHTALNKLKSNDHGLFSKLNAIRNSTKFIEVGKIRNNLTHNFPHNEISSGVEEERIAGETTYSLGVGNYTPSSQNIVLMNHSLEIITEILSLDHS